MLIRGLITKNVSSRNFNGRSINTCSIFQSYIKLEHKINRFISMNSVSIPPLYSTGSNKVDTYSLRVEILDVVWGLMYTFPSVRTSWELSTLFRTLVSTAVTCIMKTYSLGKHSCHIPVLMKALLWRVKN